MKNIFETYRLQIQKIVSLQHYSKIEEDEV